MEQRPLTLFELNALVRRSLAAALPASCWMQAELGDVRVHPSGHCYLEFVQKDPAGGGLVAKARGVVWASLYRTLRPWFEKETGRAFAAGLNVLVRVSVTFHELYGYSLTVQAVDPAYTLGDMARRRREILRRLEAEGILGLNKRLALPPLAQRVAVISSPAAAGYGDFRSQLAGNPHGLVFYTRLFPAVMQGDRVEASVIAALQAVARERDRWDAVVIIRGGGAVSDLGGFDSYPLAACCARFPLPVITGIGHERDDTVLDSVAHTRVKTPTAAAEYLVAHLRATAERLDTCVAAILHAVPARMERERVRLARLVEHVPAGVLLRLQRERHLGERMVKRLEASLRARLADGERALRAASVRLAASARARAAADDRRLGLAAARLAAAVRSRLLRERHRLELLSGQAEAASPERLLRRGYSITLKDGRAVTSADALRPGDRLVTRFARGETASIVTSSETQKQ